MTQLFHQLIDNSIKFRSEAPPQIQIGLDGMQEGQYRIYVRDNGIGMDEAYTDKVFNLFLRLHDRSSGYNGTGIGLALARKIVEQHKGSIWIESKPGQGTTVWFTLPGTPLAGSPAEASPREAAAV
jgi:chemotaxis family two-component system sensor kinase Cph1